MTPEQFAQILNLLVAVIFPVIVGLITTKTTNPALKATLLATISFASGIAGQLLASGVEGFDWFTAIVTGLGAWVVAIATHFGFWKATGVTEKIQTLRTAKHLA
jgi:hypothetical protein